MTADPRHDPLHEELLMEVLSGEADAATRAQVEGCAVCRQRQAELEPLAAELRLEGESWNEGLETALAAPAEGLDEDRFVQGLLDQLESSPAPPQPARGRLLAWVALAAAALLAVYLWPTPSEPNPEPFFLGQGGLELGLEPTGEVEQVSVVRWENVTPEGSYVLEVRRLADLEAEPALRIPDLFEAQWTPVPAFDELLRDGVRVEIHVYDELGELKGSGWADLRSPR